MKSCSKADQRGTSFSSRFEQLFTPEIDQPLVYSWYHFSRKAGEKRVKRG